jgi:hypothetical protein
MESHSSRVSQRTKKQQAEINNSVLVANRFILDQRLTYFVEFYKSRCARKGMAQASFITGDKTGREGSDTDTHVELECNFETLVIA